MSGGVEIIHLSRDRLPCKLIGQALDVFLVQVSGWLIQREDAAVQAEGLGQRESDDQGGQDLTQGKNVPG